MENEKRWITIPEAAEMLALHGHTIRKYIAAGKLPAYRVAGRKTIRLKLADVEALMEPVNAWSHDQATA